MFRFDRCAQVLNLDLRAVRLCQTISIITIEVIYEVLRRRQLVAQLLLVTVHADLRLINLEFIIIHGLHNAVRFLAELREEANIVHIVIVDVLDEVRLDHAIRNRVRVLNTLFKFNLQLLVLVQLLLVNLVLPVQSR